MKRKNDMYIDYSRSYRRRGKKGESKAVKALLVIMLALGLGFGSFYLIKLQIERTDSGNEDIQEQLLASEGTDQDADIIKDQNTEGSPDQTTVDQTTLDQTEGTSDVAGETNNGQNSTGTTNPVPTETVEELEQEVDPRVPVRVKGIYVTSSAASKQEIRDRLIEIADTTEINAMVIDVKDDHGKITYSMDSKMAKEIGAVTNAISDIDELLRTLKEKNIYVIARIVAFKDPYLAEQRQELAIKNKDGSLYRDNKGDNWVNPYNREVWDYLVEVATQAAATGFQEIQFDYIRFSTGGTISQVDYGEAAQTHSKEEIIIEFTKYAYEKLKPLGVFVSADVYGTIISSKIDAGLVGQNYVEMARYLDYICPMIYPSHFGEGNYGVKYPDLEPFKIIRKVLTASQEKLSQIPDGEHRAIVRPWLQDFTATWIKNHQKYGGRELREQIGGVYGAGYKEWLLWNASVNYSVDGLSEE